MTAAHRVRAKIRRLPPCPECGAPASEPCTDGNFECEPHEVRERIVAGEVVAIELSDARRKRMIGALRELQAAIGARIYTPKRDRK